MKEVSTQDGPQQNYNISFIFFLDSSFPELVLNNNVYAILLNPEVMRLRFQQACGVTKISHNEGVDWGGSGLFNRV